jgi:menaquinone-specific isochorismate synthase
LTIGETGVYRLKNIQHLRTPVDGELHEGLHILDIVKALHPTPALGGTPRDIAMQAIRQTELITRGWYAAPVGWLGADGTGEFAVAIRSAVSSGKRARLYAGAGIVAESDPDREWEETRLKFRPMLDALGIKEQAFLSI